MIESKIKEAQEKDHFPAMYCTADRGIVILVSEDKNPNNFIGVCVHPKEKFGEVSATWPKARFSRMPRGSELTLKIVQE